MRRAACVWALWALLVGCDGAAKGKAAQDEARAAANGPRRVELVRAEALPMDERIVIAGTLAADDEVAVKAKVGGRLASIQVDLGTPVRAGQPIAQIEAIDYRLRVEQASAALAQAKAALGLSPEDDRGDVVIAQTTGVREATATLEEARANHERARTLLERKLIGRADYDAAQATFLRAESEVQRAREEVYGRMALLKQRKAELALARQALADATIRSPLEGIVQVRSASAGEFLAQGADVATIVRVDPLRLRVEVPEREAARVSVGQRVSVRVDQREGSYEGRIARLSPMLDRQSRTLVVEAEIANPGELRPGSFARAEIDLGASAPVVSVPREAVVVFAGIEKVITVEDGKAVERPIETGRRAGGRVEVKKGLSAGEAVVLVPGTLQQGQAVEVTGERRGPNAALDGEERDARHD